MIIVVEKLVELWRAKFTVAEVGYDFSKIFPDHPREKLKDPSFPRMHLVFIGGSNEAAQLGNTRENQTFTIQANIFTRNKKKLIVVQGGNDVVHEGAKLNKRIMTDAMEILRKFQSDPILCNAGIYKPEITGVFTNFPIQDQTQQVAFQFEITRRTGL